MLVVGVNRLSVPRLEVTFGWSAPGDCETTPITGSTSVAASSGCPTVPRMISLITLLPPLLSSILMRATPRIVPPSPGSHSAPLVEFASVAVAPLAPPFVVMVTFWLLSVPAKRMM